MIGKVGIDRSWKGSWGIYINRRIDFLGPFLSCSSAIKICMYFLSISLIILLESLGTGLVVIFESLRLLLLLFFIVF